MNGASGHENGSPILKVCGLKTHFFTSEGVIKAVDGVDLEIGSGEVLGIVGESGCGKSVTSLSIMGLIHTPPGKIVAGKILFQGENLLNLNADAMQRIRGERISMIFQDPLTSLNPVLTIGTQLSEVFTFHRRMHKMEALKRAIAMLRMTNIPDPERRIAHYPHHMSGGMRQRAMIAMALSCEPALLIADEPTTALDVTVQAQILSLIKEMRNKLGTAVMMITHDMGVVANICDRVAVMYAGTIMEYTDVFTLFQSPRHPYTQGLLSSLPVLGNKRGRLGYIDGTPPRLNNLPPGCPFAPRCSKVEDQCSEALPPLKEIHENHKVRCFKAGESM